MASRTDACNLVKTYVAGSNANPERLARAMHRPNFKTVPALLAKTVHQPELRK